MTQRIFFSVGDPSGDQHTARLIRALGKYSPGVSTCGFGGQQMAAAGCDLHFDLTELAVMGLIEVVPRLRQFFRLADQAESLFRRGAVDRVVLVDFPGFNWHIARRARAAGLPVDYYLPPQLWGWAPWRIRKVRASVDRVLCALPFEYEWYRASGVPCEFVGHPFFDAVASTPLDAKMLARWRDVQRSGRRLIALLPGSRDHEVHRCGPLLLESARRLARRHPDAVFLVGAYRDSQCLWLRDQVRQTGEDLNIEFFVGKTSEVIELADVALMVSGSISLELMARRTPGVVLYRVGRLFYSVARCMMTVDSFTLPNLIAGEKIFPEFASVGDPEPAIAQLTTAAERLLGDTTHYGEVVSQLDRLVDQYARPGASDRAARLIAGANESEYSSTSTRTATASAA